MVDQELSRTEQYRRFDERARAVLPSSTLDKAPGEAVDDFDVAVMESAIKNYGFGHAAILQAAPNPYMAAFDMVTLLVDRKQDSSTWSLWNQGFDFMAPALIDDDGAEHAIASVMEHLWSIPSTHMQPKIEVPRERMLAAERLRKIVHVRRIGAQDRSTQFLGTLCRGIAEIQGDEYTEGVREADLAVLDLAREVMNILHDCIREYALISARTSN